MLRAVLIGGVICLLAAGAFALSGRSMTHEERDMEKKGLPRDYLPDYDARVIVNRWGFRSFFALGGLLVALTILSAVV